MLGVIRGTFPYRSAFDLWIVLFPRPTGAVQHKTPCERAPFCVINRSLLRWERVWEMSKCEIRMKNEFITE